MKIKNGDFDFHGKNQFFKKLEKPIKVRIT
jgi:hypothetical protein